MLRTVCIKANRMEYYIYNMQLRKEDGTHQKIYHVHLTFTDVHVISYDFFLCDLSP